MTEPCQNLATKDEVQRLREELLAEIGTKIPLDQKRALVGEAVSISGQAIQAGLALQAGRIANAMQAANSARQAATGASSLAGVAQRAASNAGRVANSANFNALYAQSRAASAANAASRAASVGSRALNLVGGVIGILGTFASLAAVAALTQQVVALKRRIDKNDEIIRANEQLARANRDSVDRLAELYSEQAQQIVENKRIGLENKNLALAADSKAQEALDKIQQVQLENAEVFNRLQEQIDALRSGNQLPDNIATNQQIQNLQNQITNSNNSNNQLQNDLQTLLDRLGGSDQQIEFITGNQNQLRRQLEDLQIAQTQRRIEQLTNNGALQEVRIRNLNDKITNFDLEIQRLGRQGIQLESSIGTANEAINSQVNQLRSEIPFTVRDTVNSPETIRNISTQVNNNTNTVEQQQVDEINQKLDQLNRNVPGLLTPTNISLAVGASSVVQQLLQNSGRISPCQAPVLVPPVGQQTRANNAAILSFQALNTGQNVAIQNTVNVVNSTTSGIRGILTNAQYGLQAIQNFASTAWQATRADKLLQVLNTALIINNGLYLSRNILSTLGDAASVGLEAIGIKDSEGNPLDVNSFVSSTIQSWISSIIGTENYEAIAEKIKQNNRIYQSAANLYSGVRSMIASAEEIAEETGIDVARIGNALRDSGTVDYDAYDHMAENPRWKGKIFDALEKGEEIADSLDNIANEVLDITEQASEFKEERKTFEELITKEKKEVARDEEVGTRRIESLPETTEEDKLESEEND